MTDISTRLEAVRTRVSLAAKQYGRASKSVTLLAVSKTKPVSAIREAAAAGQTHFGENYLQEALDKISALSDLDLVWHFIGPIQSNKTHDIAASFDWVHSVDRMKIARRLSDQRPDTLPRLNICLQINIDNEPSKSGITPAQLPQLAAEVARLPRLQLRGLMVIPAPVSNVEQQRKAFHQLSALLQALNKSGFDLDTLSMGMSSDMEAAIAEGATIVRIGTDIFGTRNAVPAQ